MPTPRKKEYSYTDAKTKTILIYADSSRFFFGKMSQILTIISAILWWERADKELLVYIFIDS